MWAVDGEEEFRDAAAFHAEVRSTGLRGGDAGHGGITQLALTGDGTDWRVQTKVDPSGSLERLDLEVRGDAELRVLAQALRWTAEQLEQAITSPTA